MKNLSILLIIALLAGFLFSQIPPTYADIDYVGDGSDKHLLDIYIPEDLSNPAPLVIWIHGGAWRSGSKGGAYRKCDSLFLNGYILADINYRFSSDSLFPAQIYDCKAAIRYLKANAEEYNIDTNRVAVAGSSAGGHLVAFLGASNGLDSLENFDLGNADVSSRVHAVCDFYGATDFLRMNDYIPMTPPDSCEHYLDHEATGSPEALLLGCPILDCPDKVAYANPLTYLDHTDPPYIIFHGTFDCTVPPYQSIILDSALSANGISHEFYLIDHAGHGAMPEFDWETQKHRMRIFLDNVFFPVSIKEFDNSLGENPIEIYPSPFQMFVNIKSPVDGVLEIYDILGNRLFTKAINRFETVNWSPDSKISSGLLYMHIKSFGSEKAIYQSRVLYLK